MTTVWMILKIAAAIGTIVTGLLALVKPESINRSIQITAARAFFSRSAIQIENNANPT